MQQNLLSKIPLLTPDDIEIRIGQINKQKKWLTLLLYKNARVDMQILDDVFGTCGWKRTHKMIGNNLVCTLSIWDDDKKEWVEKEDVGTEGNIEVEKSTFSDALKRAAVSAGIGRELYSSPPIRIYPPDCMIEESNEKLVCWDRFVVTEIRYTESRKIDFLEISKENRDGSLTVVFTWKKPASRNKPLDKGSADAVIDEEPEKRRNDILFSLPFQYDTFAKLRGGTKEQVEQTVRKRFNVTGNFSELPIERLEYIYEKVCCWVQRANEETGVSHE